MKIRLKPKYVRLGLRCCMTILLIGIPIYLITDWGWADLINRIAAFGACATSAWLIGYAQAAYQTRLLVVNDVVKSFTRRMGEKASQQPGGPIYPEPIRKD